MSGRNRDTVSLVTMVAAVTCMVLLLKKTVQHIAQKVKVEKALTDMLNLGDEIWCANFDDGSILHGKVESVYYKDYKLETIGVDWDNEITDYYDGEEVGTRFFRTEREARIALLKGEDDTAEE